MSTMDANSMSNNDSEQQVEYEVPHDLKRLIRIIMKAFYNFELYLCMEMLMIYPCVKEEDLAELLRMDVKAVHQLLLNLKKDKFVNEKSMMETSQDGSKQTKHSYFYINYRMLVCVVRYKLDRIRMLIEIDDNQSNTRALYKCTVCSKTYSDEDTKDIFYTMRCIHCGGDIDEDTSSLPKQSTRNLMNKFNNQTLLISELLSRVEHVRLADKILRPEPIDISYVLRRISPASYSTSLSSATLSSAGMTSTSSSLNLMGGGGKAAMIKYDKATAERLRTQTTVSINRDSTDTGGQAKRPIKELPSIILANRTNEEEFNRDSFLLNSVRQAADETINSTNAITNKSTLSDSTNFTQSSSGAKGGQSNASNGSACAASPSSGGSNAAANSSTTFNSSSSVNSTNLEQIILQKLLKHEKKAISESSSSSSKADVSSTNKNSNYQLSLSSITVTKKRPIDAVLNGSGATANLGLESHKNAYLANHPLNKKRKLMQGKSSSIVYMLTCLSFKSIESWWSSILAYLLFEAPLIYVTI